MKEKTTKLFEIDHSEFIFFGFQWIYRHKNCNFFFWMGINSLVFILNQNLLLLYLSKKLWKICQTKKKTLDFNIVSKSAIFLPRLSVVQRAAVHVDRMAHTNEQKTLEYICYSLIYVCISLNHSPIFTTIE